jgi:feruloyl-CoA synthase
VLTGMNRDDVGAWCSRARRVCRAWPGLGADVPLPEVLHQPGRCAPSSSGWPTELWRDGTGSANRVARLHVLAEPPSIDKGEITDKGSINQRAVLTHRDALVQALYEGRAPTPS